MDRYFSVEVFVILLGFGAGTVGYPVSMIWWRINRVELRWKANDQHPPLDVRLGEYLITEVYDTLLNSPLWEKSLLVVLYDEHWGFFDRVPPPGSVPSLDGKKSKHPPFDFTGLGMHVPAILVSPLVEKG